MPAQDFLAKHWQKSTFFMPGAIRSLSPSLEPQELAWLATQDDVESRLVFIDRSGSEITYRVETGPFDDQLLASLPPRDWTLLVQDVEKHLPDFSRLLSHVSFVPDWRIDDLMISFAAPGGSVGPHKDNYDVFLCQGSGRREWRLAGPNETSASDACDQLTLLQPFADPAPLDTKSGDVLYLPPGKPHWGIAGEACMTYSIGMRAPSLGELRLCFDRELRDIVNPFPQTPGENKIFYTDPDLDHTESAPGRISAASIDRCRNLISDDAGTSDQYLATALGCVATDLKAWLAPDIPSATEISNYLGACSARETALAHGMSKIAWWSDDGKAMVFANGAHKTVTPDDLTMVQSICSSRHIGTQQLCSLANNELVLWLLNMGTFDLFMNNEAIASPVRSFFGASGTSYKDDTGGKT